MTKRAQLPLAIDTKPRTWGGRRKNAGRKRQACNASDPSHARRPALSPRTPVHVVLRVKKGVPRLRTGRAYAAVRRVLVRCLGVEAFRVVHVSIQRNHLHLLVEAADRRALSNHMKRLAILLARALNKELGRAGKLFAFRYHATQITSRRQARHVLAYVLNNWRRHREDEASVPAALAMVDPYSSAVSFTGWAGVQRFALPDGYEPLPVTAPRTWLLSAGWHTHGKLDPFECPGALA